MAVDAIVETRDGLISSQTLEMSSSETSSLRTSITSGSRFSSVGEGDFTESSGSSIRDIHAGEIKIPPAITKFLKESHQGLFSLLFALQRRSRGIDIPIFVYTLEVLEKLQLLSFPFKFSAKFPWNPQHTSWWISLVNFAVPENFVQGNSTLFYVALAILGIVLLNAVVVGYFFAKNQFRFMWTLRYLRVICTLFMTILYIPTVTLFTSMMVQCADGGGNIAPIFCWQGVTIVRTILAIILGAWFIALTLLFAVSVFQQDPTEETSIWARAHSRAEVSHLVQKTVLSVMFVIFGKRHDATSMWILSVTCVVCSFSSLFMFVWFMPFFRWRSNVFRVSMLSLFAWASVCLLFVIGFNDPTNSLSIMFFFVSPCIIVLAIYALNFRKNMVILHKLKTTTNPCTIELKARFLLEDANLLNKKHIVTYNSDGIKGHEKLREITEMYESAATLLPNSSSLYMFWANFALYHCGNKQRSLVLLTQCMKRDPWIDEEFVAFRQRKIMNEEAGSDNLDMLEFILCEAYMKKAYKHERRAILLQSRFWNELGQEKVDLQRLFLLGSAVNAQVTAAEISYNKAIQSNRQSPNVLRAYSKFLQDVVNDPRKSEEYAERAKQLDTYRRRNNLAGDGTFDLANIIAFGWSDKETALFTMNCKGIILSANSGANTIFGYERSSQLVGSNISTLVPPPFDKAHDSFIQKYLDVGEGHIIAKLRKVFAIRQDGYLIPVMLLVRQLTYGMNGTFLGVFRAVPEGTLSHDYILMDGQGQIKAFTERCTDYFGNTPGDVERYQLNINDWIENFNSVSQYMKEQTGYKIQIEIDERVIELISTLTNIVVAGFSISIMKLSPANVILRSSVAAAGGEVDVHDIKSQLPMNFITDVLYKPNKDQKALISVKGVVSKQETDKQDRAEKEKAGPAEPLKDAPKSKADEKTIIKKIVSTRPARISSTEHSVPHSPEAKRKKGAAASIFSGPAPTHISQHSQTSTALNRLMRATFSRKIESSTYRLTALSRFLLFAFIFAAAVVVANNVIWARGYDLYLTNAYDIEVSGDNMANVTSCLLKIRALQETTDPSAILKQGEEILSLTRLISWSHFQLYNHSEYLGDKRVLFTSTTRTIVDISTNTTISVSLNDAITTFTSQVVLLVKSIMTGSAQTSVTLSSLSAIAYDTIDPALKELTSHYLYQYQTTASYLRDRIYPFAFAPIGLMYLGCFVIVVIIFLRINAESKVLYRLFLDVPKDVIMFMHQSCLEKLSNVDLNAETGVLSAIETEKGTQNQVSGLFDISQASQDVKSGNDNDDRGSRNEFINLAKMILRGCLFIAITLAYFLGFAIYAQFYIDHTAGYGAVTAWAAETSAKIQEVNFRAIMLMKGIQVSLSDVDFDSRIKGLNRTIDELVSYRDAFIYGNDNLRLKDWVDQLSTNEIPGFDPLSTLIRLTFDAPITPDFSIDECETVHHAAMDHGLLNGIDEYSELANDIMVALQVNPAGALAFESSPTVKSFNMLGKVCLPEYFDLFNKKEIGAMRTATTAVNTYAHPISTVILIIAIGTMYYTVFKPLLWSVQREVSLTPSMLLMLPPEVLMKIESIRAFTSENSELN